MAEAKTSGRITVMTLRNFAPPEGSNIPADKIDALGRVCMGTVVDLPRDIASKFIKAKIVSADAAIS